MQYSRYNVWSEAGGRHWVFNGVTGALVDLTGPERAAADALVGSGATPGSASHFDKLAQLVRCGVLRNDGVDELDELERQYRFDRLGSGAMALTIVTSLGCNFDCPYCFEEKEPALLQPEVADAIVAMVSDSMPGLERLSVTWFGGEPLLGREVLYDLSDRLIERCDANGTSYSARIVTNGWHLTEPVAQALAQRRVRAAQVTIDGPPRIHDARRPHATGRGTFERVVTNVATAVDHLQVDVRVNLAGDNIGVLDELLDALAARGLAGRVPVSASPLTDIATNAQAPLASYESTSLTTPQFADVEIEFAALARRHGFQADDGLPSRRRLSCAIVTPTSIVIGPRGELWKCWDEVGDSSAVFGTIHDYHQPSPMIRKWATYSPFDDQQCRGCIALPVCMGGCPQIAFHQTDRDAQCGTFRFNHQRKVDLAAARAAGLDPEVATPILDSCQGGCSTTRPSGAPTAVSIGPSRRRAPSPA